MSDTEYKRWLDKLAAFRAIEGVKYGGQEVRDVFLREQAASLRAIEARTDHEAHLKAMYEAEERLQKARGVEADRHAVGGTKHDSGKPRPELLPADALLEVAKVMAYGASKYGDNNWRKGFAYSRLQGAALRHLLAFAEGNDVDDETGLPHLAHAAATVLMLLSSTLNGYGHDDGAKS